MQLDEGSRGFSFLKEGPLDMRMDPSGGGVTAREIVNRWSEEELGRLFREGEERRWRQVARAIVQERKKGMIETTTQLAAILTEAVGRGRNKKLHPATLVFQALRMSVNGELESVREGIASAIQMLAPGGRIGVLSFHSLEDRLVKELFRAAAKPIKKVVERGKEKVDPLLRLLTKKPLVPTMQESRANRRSRSAKLRAAERL